MLLDWFRDKRKKITIYINIIFKKKCLVLINTPTHGNLGDQAIAYAEQQFLHDYFPDYCLIEISAEVSACKWINFGILSKLNSYAIFLIHAGGYLGDLWPNEEKRIQKILEKIDKNKKIILPQTYFVCNGGRKSAKYQEDKIFYRSMKNFVVCLRDSNSYVTFITEILNKEQCYLLPDIVTYLKQFGRECQLKEGNSRKGVLLCMRRDHEKVVSSTIENELIQWLENMNLQFSYTDTCVDHLIFKTERKQELQKKLYEFARAEVVITDRIHGMIFAAITGTPCIALDNVSKKVSGAYEWIKYLDYITLITDPTSTNVIHSIRSVMNCSDNQYDNTVLIPYYKQLAECIRGNKLNY